MSMPTLSNNERRTLRRALDLLSDVVDSEDLSSESWYAIHRKRLVRDLRTLRKLTQGKAG